jgi:hypothetical protein
MFILVTIDSNWGDGVNATAHGFIRGEDGMQARFIDQPDKSRPECWLIPKNALIPFDPTLLMPGI